MAREPICYPFVLTGAQGCYESKFSGIRRQYLVGKYSVEVGFLK
jgi:hypothetical protein